MFCKIADLIAEVPSGGGLESCCKDYICGKQDGADIVIDETRYRPERYPAYLSESELAYMEAAYQFYFQLLKFQGFYLHASAVALDGYSYLFSGHCGAGKSTHTGLWQQTFGEKAKVFNDDKPALRRVDGRWYAYGTPWCGKNHVNINMKEALAGICFIKQAPENRIRRLPPLEATSRVLGQTIRRRLSAQEMDMMLPTLEKLITEIPVFELECRVDKEAALLSYKTMRDAAKEAGL